MRAAHPRSRGENVLGSHVGPVEHGSSPLTRGKRKTFEGNLLILGLIPAHAGKTRRRGRSQQLSWAHPRSRGENACVGSEDVVGVGSSPLTRGKLGLEDCGGLLDRLIPAHAGKTYGGARKYDRGGAHPRSRGENSAMASLASLFGGSSPLTRGKPGGQS